MILSYQHFQGTSLSMVFVDFQGKQQVFQSKTSLTFLHPLKKTHTHTLSHETLRFFLQETIDAMWQAITIVNGHLNNNNRMVVEPPLVL